MTRGARQHGPNPLWARAPLGLLRYPGVLVALLVGALLMALTITAYPLFVSANAGRLVEDRINAPLVTRYGAGITYRSGDVPLGEEASGPIHERRDRLFRELTGRSPYLGEPVAGVLGPIVTLSPEGRPERTRMGRLFGGTDAVGHITVVASGDEEGVWLPEVLVRGLRVRPGDTVTIGTSAGGSVLFPVAGVYRGLYLEPRRGYWLPWDSEIYPSQACQVAACPPPEPFVLVPEDRIEDTMRALGVRHATFGWQAPLARGAELSLDEARDLQGFVASFRTHISDRSTEAGRVFRCCRPVTFGARQEIEMSSRIRLVVRLVEERLTAIEGPGRLLQWAGIAVALAVVAGAGVFQIAARRVEARLLAARGTGPGIVGIKAGLEAVLPCLLGAAAGLGAALVLVSTVGPEGALASSARRGALAGAALAFAVAVVAVGTTSAIAAVGHHSRGELHRSLLARVPWEVGLLALAVLAFRSLESGGAVTGTGPVGRPGFALLLFPAALVGGIGLLGGRLFRRGFRALRGRSESFSPPAYLAVQRVAGSPGLAVLLFGAAGLCLGAFVQSETLVGSLERTVDAKARVFVGSDARAWVSPDTVIPRSFPLPATKVVRLAEAGTMESPGQAFDLLAVDPETLARAAYWDEGFADVPLAQITDRLAASDTSEASAVPVVLAGPGPSEVGSIEMNQRVVLVDVVARTESFPGMYPRHPLVVMDRSVVCRSFRGTLCPLSEGNARNEVWVKGDTRTSVAALATLPEGAYSTVTAEQVKDIPYIAAVIDTFVVLNALGLGTGVLVVAAMLLYLQARERSQVVAYGLSLRMGMTDRTHRWALLLELGATLVTSFVLGVAVAVAAVAVTIGYLDPLGTIPPDPFLQVPTALVAGALIALVAVAWFGAWLANRQARTTHLGEVMRVAE